MAYAAPSTWHSNVTGLSGDVKVMVAEVELTSAPGPEVIVVSGGSVTRLHSRNATGLRLPARSTARTSKR